MTGALAARVLACGGLLASLPQCTDPDYVSLGGNLAAPILAADAGTPAAAPTSTDSAPAPDSCEPSADAVSLADNCAQRREVPCSAPADPNAVATDRERLDLTLDQLLRECAEQLNVLKVELSAGCVTRFELSMPPVVAGCISGRLEATRFACAGGASCARGDVFLVPVSAVPPDWL